MNRRRIDMSAKNRDRHGRWRSRTVAFRVSEDEFRSIDEAVALSGLTKQDYLISKLLDRDVVVYGNPRVFQGPKRDVHIKAPAGMPRAGAFHHSLLLDRCPY